MHYHGKRLYQPCCAYCPIPQFTLCSSLAARAITVVFGLGTRLCVYVCTRLENGVLCNGQQPGSAMNIFIDKFEAIRLWVLVEFCTVVCISFMVKLQWVLELFSSYRCLNKVVITKKERITKNCTFSCVYLSSARLLGNYVSLAYQKSPQKGWLGT